MCGICGIVSIERGKCVDSAILRQMCQLMHHRGPDEEGFYLDERAGLGVRRLSIIDLVTGHQPISNEDRSVWVVFNGEIYNYQTIRRELEQKGHVFATQTDTEAIVHAYEEYGDRCVEHFNGMFAFAIWDTCQRRLLLARDRLGIKPLYYCFTADALIFGSELKAVIAHPEVSREIDLTALDHFLTLEYIPAPNTIFAEVKKLPPGHLLSIQGGGQRLVRYWDIPLVPIIADYENCIEALTDLIRDAVRLRLQSDVPLGAFLSGGIDSGTVVAFMSELSDAPVSTFSIGFGDDTYNELPFARMISSAFDTYHYEAVMQPDISHLIEKLVSQFDEPFGDFSIFPTYLVSQLARDHVKVVLSGDGGDEIFAGYDTYLAQRVAERYERWLPGSIRQTALPFLMGKVRPRPAKKGVVNKARRFVEGAALDPELQHSRWMIFLSDADKAALYHPELQSSLNGVTPEVLLKECFRQAQRTDHLTQQQYVDVKTYLAENILTKVDRMSMACSLEVRVPLLDHRIVEFALNLPPDFKLSGGTTKAILRRVMADRLPAAVLDKPKQGFSIPLKHWLRGDLQPLMRDLLATDTVRRRGYFNPGCIEEWVSDHQAQRANHSHRLWALMVFEMWYRQTMDSAKYQTHMDIQ